MTKTENAIKEDLKTLRLYYSAKAQLDISFKYIPNKATQELVSDYTQMIANAPLELYMLYCELYVNGSKQEDAAQQLGYCTESIRLKNKKLIKFFQSKFVLIER